MDNENLAIVLSDRNTEIPGNDGDKEYESENDEIGIDEHDKGTANGDEIDSDEDEAEVDENHHGSENEDEAEVDENVNRTTENGDEDIMDRHDYEVEVSVANFVDEECIGRNTIPDSSDEEEDEFVVRGRRRREDDKLALGTS